MVMMLALRGELAAVGHCANLTMNKNPRKYDLFGLSSMVCQLDRKPFLWPPHHRLTIHFQLSEINKFSNCKTERAGCRADRSMQCLCSRHSTRPCARRKLRTHGQGKKGKRCDALKVASHQLAHQAYFQLSGEKITHKKQKRELARRTQRNSQGPCRVNHEKRTFPTLRCCR